MLTGARLERVRKAMQAVEDRVVREGHHQPVVRKGDKLVQTEIERELKRLSSGQRGRNVSRRLT